MFVFTLFCAIVILPGLLLQCLRELALNYLMSSVLYKKNSWFAIKFAAESYNVCETAPHCDGLNFCELAGNSAVCVYHTSHKKFSEEKQVHVGMEDSTINQTRWEWHHNTFTSFLHLVPFCHHLHKYALCLSHTIPNMYYWVCVFFHHVAAPYPDSRICKHFITHGCKLGSQCRFLHCTPEELASQMAHEQQQGQGPPRRPNGGPPPPHHREPQSAEHMDTSGSTLASNEPQT